MHEDTPRSPKLPKAAALMAVLVVACFVAYETTHTIDTPPKQKSATTIEQKTPKPTIEAPKGSALEALGVLAVKGRAPKTDYSRDQFGAGWAETEGCDTRNYILQRDLTDTVRDIEGCKVITGTLHDPYTDKVIHFQRGATTSDDIQIDHVVALSDAWQKGAQQLDVAERTQFANDPTNLLAVDGPINEAKGDKDAASWLPPNKVYRCPYVARQIAVKTKYHLWVTTAEHDAMQTVLTTCPNEQLPVNY